MTFSGHGHPDDPDAYWRRRFFILGGGLAVLMLAAGLFGGGGPSRQASQAAAVRASTAAREARGSLPSAALGPAYGTRPSVSGSPSPSTSPSSSPTGGAATATPSPSASGSATGPGSAAAGSAPGGRCAAGSVVLSLFTSQPAYRPSQPPKFDIYAVSTSASACLLRYGPAAVRLVVTRQGKVIWDSATCKTTRQGAKIVSMAPGVPQEVVFSWDRKASDGSCAGALPRDGTGTFQAAAQADGRTSPVRSFRLLRS